MNRMMNDHNVEVKRTINKPETTYAYETTFPVYTTSSAGSTVSQPLPGQPPLPPMPPPPGALPPLPMFPAMPQVTQLQTWAPTGPWQWITPQSAAVQAQSARDITNSTLQSARGNYTRRERFNHNRNNIYSQRGNFHRNKNRRRFEHQSQHNQFDPTTYWQNIDWQRTNFAAAQGDPLVSHVSVPMTAQINSTGSGTSSERADAGDQEVKIVSEVPVKKSKQRKPMSQSYPIRNWNLEDAKSALKVENEYNKTVRAQSLIIKFPDPDLNKDIVREFHPGIQNIHFQSPSGPRYCFIQMAENVDIDMAIEELEKIPFGIGHLKVERKSLRDEDYPQPEEIDPYTLYVGNLPESVNVNEVKSKFPTATRVDVGYAQKMRNTRYAFIRYANVEESIAAYKQAHDLMWDTRSIIVRFRRANTRLPNEGKNTKKVKDEPDEGVKKEKSICNGNQAKQATREVACVDRVEKLVTNGAKKNVAGAIMKQPDESWPSQVPQTATPTQQLGSESPAKNIEEDIIVTTIKEEPEDYDEIDMAYIPMGDDDSDDENDEPDEMDDTNDEMDENDNDQDDNDSDNLLNCENKDKQNDDTNSEAPDHLDHMFNELDNIVDDIDL